MCQSLLPLHLSLSFSVILYSLLFPSNAFLSVSSFSLFFTLFLCFSLYGSLPIYVLLLLSICILPLCLPNLDYLLFASLSFPLHHSPLHYFCLSSSLFSHSINNMCLFPSIRSYLSLSVVLKALYLSSVLLFHVYFSICPSFESFPLTLLCVLLCFPCQ
jgi:hypothetical protein